MTHVECMTQHKFLSYTYAAPEDQNAQNFMMEPMRTEDHPDHASMPMFSMFRHILQKQLFLSPGKYPYQEVFTTSMKIRADPSPKSLQVISSQYSYTVLQINLTTVPS